MKMSSLKYSTVFIYAVFIAIEAASGQENIVNKFGVIGRKVSFGPDRLTPPISSIVWKQRNSDGVIVKAIEWDEDGFSIPHPRFKNITTLDKKTGHITITSLNGDHAGTYILEINSKEQGQKFKLEFMPPVPDPKIIIVPIKGVSDTVYLECRYSETIIWKNSSGETLEGSATQPKGQSLTVKDTGKPDNFYTCTLENAASESTSDPVYERDLFKGSKAGLIAGLVIFFIIFFIIAFIAFYLLNKSLRNRVNKSCPCIESALRNVNCFKKQGQKSSGGSKGPDSPENYDYLLSHEGAKQLESKSIRAGESNDEAAEGQKTFGGSKGPDSPESATYDDLLGPEGAKQLESISIRAGESNDEAAEDQNNAERNPGPETTK